MENGDWPVSLRLFEQSDDRRRLLPAGFAYLYCLRKWMLCEMIKRHFHTTFRFHGNDETKGSFDDGM